MRRFGRIGNSRAWPDSWTRHKLIEYHVHGERHTQLFDLEHDPWETRNLAEESAHAPTRNRLRDELVRLRDEWDDHQPEVGQQFWGGVTFPNL